MLITFCQENSLLFICSKVTIIKLEERFNNSRADINDLKQRLSAAEATWTMAENLYRQLADQVRENSYDIKDLSR